MSRSDNLLMRCHSKCELCSAQASLSIYDIPPVSTPSEDKAIMVCATCLSQISDPTDLNHWRCLSTSIWSEFPAVQVVTWRLLKKLSNQNWAQDLLSQIYLDEDNQKWAQAEEPSQDDDTSTSVPTKDSNGNTLTDGDSVTLIKDLDVKGAGFTAKRGTLVKNIALTPNPSQIEGRVNGTSIVLLTCYLKKVS